MILVGLGNAGKGLFVCLPERHPDWQIDVVRDYIQASYEMFEQGLYDGLFDRGLAIYIEGVGTCFVRSISHILQDYSDEHYPYP